MDQLVKEESQKLIAKQMRQARIQRQMQVRQQALAWTEATRKKFDETKEREIKRLADTVTDEAQNRAIQSIQHLTEQNDLAMAEIGMAHRAAAGYHGVEKLKSLKRLKDEEVAKNRGVSAIMKQKKENMSKSATSLAMLKRKEAVRKAEDKKSKELISRRPLKVTNTNIDTRLKPEVNLGPPEYQPSLAKTLRIAPEQASQSGDHKKIRKTSSGKKGSLPVVVSSSSDIGLKSRPQVVKEGVLMKMARIKTLYDPRSTVPADQSETNNLLQKGLGLRTKYQVPKKSTGSAAAIPENPTVRYFDVSVPKGEVKYIAPKGLAVKESSYSPDAWEKGRESSQKIRDDEMRKTQKDDEISQIAAERGKLALKKARLEKQMSQVRNDLLQEIDFQIMGSGSQTAILGLDDDSDVKSVVLHQDLSSDDFSAVETDDEFEFPQPTMKTFAVGEDKTDKHLMLVPIDDKGLAIKESNYSPDLRERRRESTQKILDEEVKETQKEQEISQTSIMGLDDYSDVNSVVYQSQDLSSDDFSAVETDEEFEFPQPIMKTSVVGEDKTDKDIMLEPVDEKELLVKESNYSPDAGERRRKSESTQKTLDVEMKETQKDYEISQKAAEREKLGSKKARLEKQISQILSDLLQEPVGDEGLAKNESNYSPDPKQSSLSRNSDDESLLVKLTIKESTQTTPLSSDRSSVSTDYYSPPDGPFTSTPDGKLHPKPNLYNANKTGKKSAHTIKRLTLYHYVDKFLARRPESIEALPVTSSSSSVIRADSGVLSTESFEALREKSSSYNHSYSRSGSDSSREKSSSNNHSHTRSSSDSREKKSSSHSSVDVTWRNLALPTVSEEDSELESGSTIAEAAVVAGIGDLETQSTANTSSNKSSSSSRGSSNDSTSHSLTGMLNTLSRHQAIEKGILEKEAQSSSPGGSDTVLSYSQALGIENLDETQGSRHSRSQSSSGSIPDVSYILRQLRSRHNRVNSSQSSRSTPKSGPEKETERVELLSDVTPVKFWETPPQQPVQNEHEQVSAVFDKLKGKWSNVKIDPPDWFVN